MCTRGSSPWRYPKPLYGHQFLSTNTDDTASALKASVTAARVLPHAGRANVEPRDLPEAGGKRAPIGFMQ